MFVFVVSTVERFPELLHTHLEAASSYSLFVGVYFLEDIRDSVGFLFCGTFVFRFSFFFSILLFSFFCGSQFILGVLFKVHMKIFEFFFSYLDDALSELFDKINRTFDPLLEKHLRSVRFPFETKL